MTKINFSPRQKKIDFFVPSFPKHTLSFTNLKMSAIEMNTVDAPVAAPAVTPVMALLEQVKTLSFADLLAFNVGLGAHIKSEFKKVAKKAKKAKNPDAPKRQLSVGMLAWKAFVKHIVATKPEMFDGVTKATKKQEIVSEYKKEHTEEYAAFVSAFVPPVVATVVTDDGDCVVGQLEQSDKITEVSMSNAAPDFVATTTEKPKKVTEDKPKKVKTDSEDKPKKVKTDSEDKPKKVKTDSEDKPKKVKPVSEEQPKYKKIEVDGVSYWLITKTNEVYTCENDDSFGEEVGTYNSGAITFA